MRRPIFVTLVYFRPICITLAWLVITITLIILTGCATQAVPVKPKFPEAIQSLMVPCPDLKEAQQTTKLSEVVSGVTQNYGMYHKCKLQNEMWIEWYNDQKKIYDEVK